ncbi:MAG: hemolysin III family protein [Lentisphaeria bacterium]|nr:hemolysin III family protein [Lentisphaeria bacterium]
MPQKIKHYSAREEKFSAYSHLAGVLLAIAGGSQFIRLAAEKNDTLFTGGLIFYWVSLILMFGASGFYHLCRSEKLKVHARKVDHCAIYLLITGTYAPLITGAVKTAAGYIVLLTLIALTLLGIAGKLLFANKFHFLEVVLYIAMGWACIFIARDLIANMSGKGLLLLLAGGISYTGGVIFYIGKKEFCHAVWHLFVLAGAILQYLAILTF